MNNTLDRTIKEQEYYFNYSVKELIEKIISLEEVRDELKASINDLKQELKRKEEKILELEVSER